MFPSSCHLETKHLSLPEVHFTNKIKNLSERTSGRSFLDQCASHAVSDKEWWKLWIYHQTPRSRTRDQAPSRAKTCTKPPVLLPLFSVFSSLFQQNRFRSSSSGLQSRFSVRKKPSLDWNKRLFFAFPVVGKSGGPPFLFPPPTASTKAHHACRNTAYTPLPIDIPTKTTRKGVPGTSSPLPKRLHHFVVTLTRGCCVPRFFLAVHNTPFFDKILKKKLHHVLRRKQR